MDQTIQKESDHIFINDFEVSCRVGETPEERAFPQILYVSLNIFLSLKKAADTDDLSKTVDYAQVIRDIQKVLQAKTFNLIEGVAGTISSLILKNEKVIHVQIQVSKKVFPGVKAIGVVINRDRS